MRLFGRRSRSDSEPREPSRLSLACGERINAVEEPSTFAFLGRPNSELDDFVASLARLEDRTAWDADIENSFQAKVGRHDVLTVPLPSEDSAKRLSRRFAGLMKQEEGRPHIVIMVVSLNGAQIDAADVEALKPWLREARYVHKFFVIVKVDDKEEIPKLDDLRKGCFADFPQAPEMFEFIAENSEAEDYEALGRAIIHPNLVLRSTKFVVVGNPGSGKSSFLNGVLQEAHFRAGVKAATGLTQTLESRNCLDAPYHVHDMPGLGDVSPELMKNAAQALVSAMTVDGWYKVLFFFNLDKGKLIRQEDIDTMAAVLSLTTDKEGKRLICEPIVVLNKVPEKLANELEKKKERSEFMEPIQSKFLELGFKEMTLMKAVLVIKYVREWDEKEDTIMDVTSRMRSQLDEAPSIPVFKKSMEDAMRATARQEQKETTTGSSGGNIFYKLKLAINSILP